MTVEGLTQNIKSFNTKANGSSLAVYEKQVTWKHKGQKQLKKDRECRVIQVKYTFFTYPVEEKKIIEDILIFSV